MAGRIRTIKPELMEDAVTAGLSHAAFRLFVGMILLADDHGHLRANPRWLAGQVFHGRDLDETCNICGYGGSIEDLVAELGAKLVMFYEVDGQRYARLNGWQKHQRIDNAGPPRIPLPPGWTAKEVRRTEGNRERVRWEVVPPTAAPSSTKQKRGRNVAAHRGEPPRNQEVVRPDPDLDQDHDYDSQVSSADQHVGPGVGA